MNKQENKVMKRQAEQRLASEIEEVMKHNETENLQWQGTKVDLIEAVYAAFTSCQLQNDEGEYLSFINIVRDVCRILHLPQPRNPYETAARGLRRKGFRRHPFMDRYLLKINRQPNCHPLWEQIASATNL